MSGEEGNVPINEQGSRGTETCESMNDDVVDAAESMFIPPASSIGGSSARLGTIGDELGIGSYPSNRPANTFQLLNPSGSIAASADESEGESPWVSLITKSTAESMFGEEQQNTELGGSWTLADDNDTSRQQSDNIEGDAESGDVQVTTDDISNNNNDSNDPQQQESTINSTTTPEVDLGITNSTEDKEIATETPESKMEETDDENNKGTSAATTTAPAADAGPTTEAAPTAAAPTATTTAPAPDAEVPTTETGANRNNDDDQSSAFKMLVEDSSSFMGQEDMSLQTSTLSVDVSEMVSRFTEPKASMDDLDDILGPMGLSASKSTSPTKTSASFQFDADNLPSVTEEQATKDVAQATNDTTTEMFVDMSYSEAENSTSKDTNTKQQKEAKKESPFIDLVKNNDEMSAHRKPKMEIPPSAAPSKREEPGAPKGNVSRLRDSFEKKAQEVAEAVEASSPKRNPGSPRRTPSSSPRKPPGIPISPTRPAEDPSLALPILGKSDGGALKPKPKPKPTPKQQVGDNADVMKKAEKELEALTQKNDVQEETKASGPSLNEIAMQKSRKGKSTAPTAAQQRADEHEECETRSSDNGKSKEEGTSSKKERSSFDNTKEGSVDDTPLVSDPPSDVKPIEPANPFDRIVATLEQNHPVVKSPTKESFNDDFIASKSSSNDSGFWRNDDDDDTTVSKDRQPVARKKIASQGSKNQSVDTFGSDIEEADAESKGGRLWEAAEREAEQNGSRPTSPKESRFAESLMARTRSRADPDAVVSQSASLDKDSDPPNMIRVGETDESIILSTALARKRVRVVQLLIVGLIGLLVGFLGSFYVQSSCHFVSAQVEVGQSAQIFELHYGLWKYSPMDSVFQGYSYCYMYDDKYTSDAPMIPRWTGCIALVGGAFSLAVLWFYLIFGSAVQIYWRWAVACSAISGILQLSTLSMFAGEVCQRDVCSLGPAGLLSVVAGMVWFLLAFEMHYNMPMSAYVPEIVSPTNAEPGALMANLEMTDFEHGAKAYVDRIVNGEDEKMPSLNQVQRDNNHPMGEAMRGSYKPPTLDLV